MVDAWSKAVSFFEELIRGEDDKARVEELSGNEEVRLVHLDDAAPVQKLRNEARRDNMGDA